MQQNLSTVLQSPTWRLRIRSVGRPGSVITDFITIFYQEDSYAKYLIKKFLLILSVFVERNLSDKDVDVYDFLSEDEVFCFDEENDPQISELRKIKMENILISFIKYCKANSFYPTNMGEVSFCIDEFYLNRWVVASENTNPPIYWDEETEEDFSSFEYEQLYFQP